MCALFEMLAVKLYDGKQKHILTPRNQKMDAKMLLFIVDVECRKKMFKFGLAIFLQKKGFYFPEM